MDESNWTYTPLGVVDDISVTILKGIIKTADHKSASKNILSLKCEYKMLINQIFPPFL